MPNKQHNGHQTHFKCCLPQGCAQVDREIDEFQPKNAVRVVCSNEQCQYGRWMHADCFDGFEQRALTILRNCSRARNWSEKQKQQNVWTKKGYDLVYKACQCLCGRGHIRKDLDAPKVEAAPGKRRHKSASSVIRPRTESLSSGGSASTSPPSPVNGKFDFFLDKEHAAAGNIFRRRTSLDAFESLPADQQNSYHIKLEDEGPHGNDGIRKLVLCALTKLNVTTLRCVLCSKSLPVFDQYPLIDGTLFLTPYRYGTCANEVTWKNGKSNLCAVCLECLQGDIRCRNCRKAWNGRTLQLGTMYTFDVFAADQCCEQRSSCNRCMQPVLDKGNSLHFFSDYSRATKCPHCFTEDYHFIKPLSRIYFF